MKEKPLSFNDYQREARKTAIYPDLGDNPFYPTLGLCGEAGEVAEKIKKVMRDDGGKVTDEKRAELVKELGDVMWYLANLATELGLKLEFVANYNLEKLRDRQKRNKLKGSGDDR